MEHKHYICFLFSKFGFTAESALCQNVVKVYNREGPSTPFDGASQLGDNIQSMANTPSFFILFFLNLKFLLRCYAPTTIAPNTTFGAYTARWEALIYNNIVTNFTVGEQFKINFLHLNSKVSGLFFSRF